MSSYFNKKKKNNKKRKYIEATQEDSLFIESNINSFKTNKSLKLDYKFITESKYEKNNLTYTNKIYKTDLIKLSIIYKLLKKMKKYYMIINLIIV